jgi:hypothetical protein
MSGHPALPVRAWGVRGAKAADGWEERGRPPASEAGPQPAPRADARVAGFWG